MPQTKEDIIFSKEQDSDGMSSYISYNLAEECMDEYAEQQSTAFLTWAVQNHWRMNVMDNTNTRWTNLDHDPPTISCADLYKLFQEKTTQTEQ